MEKYYVCPECGTTGIRSETRTIQEIDAFSMVFHPPQTLTELKCEECGWLAATSQPAGPL